MIFCCSLPSKVVNQKWVSSIFCTLRKDFGFVGSCHNDLSVKIIQLYVLD